MPTLLDLLILKILLLRFIAGAGGSLNEQTDPTNQCD